MADAGYAWGADLAKHLSDFDDNHMAVASRLGGVHSWLPLSASGRMSPRILCRHLHQHPTLSSLARLSAQQPQ